MVADGGVGGDGQRPSRLPPPPTSPPFFQMDLLLWASYRSQLLARTVRGMMAYEAALRLLAHLECPKVRPWVAGVWRGWGLGGGGHIVKAACHCCTHTPFPQPPGMSEVKYEALVEDVVRSKFTYVVASQVRRRGRDGPGAPG